MRRLKLLALIICVIVISSGIGYYILNPREVKPPIQTPIQTPTPEEEGKEEEPTLGLPRTDISETWKLTLEQARTDRFYKYGIYASRILAVVHPEVYLKADILFLSYLEDLKFSLESLNLESVKTVECNQVYPDGYDCLPFLDRRLLSITSTLMATNHEVKR